MAAVNNLAFPLGREELDAGLALIAQEFEMTTEILREKIGLTKCSPDDLVLACYDRGEVDPKAAHCTQCNGLNLQFDDIGFFYNYTRTSKPGPYCAGCGTPKTAER